MNEDQQYSAKSYVDQLRKSVGTNRDSNGLGKINVGGPFIVGAVDAINGADGQEVPGYIPTVHELKQLAAYWYEERIDHDFESFAYRRTDSRVWRWSVFTGRRLSRLAEILGDDAMQEVWEKAIASYRHKLTDEDWRIFTSGTDEEQEAWRQTLFAERPSELE